MKESNKRILLIFVIVFVVISYLFSIIDASLLLVGLLWIITYYEVDSSKSKYGNFSFLKYYYLLIHSINSRLHNRIVSVTISFFVFLLILLAFSRDLKSFLFMCTGFLLGVLIYFFRGVKLL